MSLVELKTLIPDCIVDLPYATTNNITGRVLYVDDDLQPKLDEAAALALKAAAAKLRSQNYKLVIWDAFRPPEVQQSLRQVNSDSRYVLEESNHVKGLAIDLTLASLDGTYLDMGTNHDDFTDKAHADSPELSGAQKANRLILRKAMEQSGFTQWPYEWWHYDYVQVNN